MSCAILIRRADTTTGVEPWTRQPVANRPINFHLSNNAVSTKYHITTTRGNERKEKIRWPGHDNGY